MFLGLAGYRNETARVHHAVPQLDRSRGGRSNARYAAKKREVKMSGTRRDFLRRVAQAGGYRATYLTMQAMGLLGPAPVTEPRSSSLAPGWPGSRRPTSSARPDMIVWCSKPVIAWAAATGPSDPAPGSI